MPDTLTLSESHACCGAHVYCITDCTHRRGVMGFHMKQNASYVNWAPSWRITWSLSLSLPLSNSLSLSLARSLFIHLSPCISISIYLRVIRVLSFSCKHNADNPINQGEAMFPNTNKSVDWGSLYVYATGNILNNP